MSVAAFAVFGFTLMKREATWPPSKIQFTVSPAKTLATFSSAGKTISVDCSKPARTCGRRRRFRDDDRARRAGLKWMRIGGGVN